MKTMCPPGYHHNGFVATHALGHMMYGYIYIYIYILGPPSGIRTHDLVLTVYLL